MDDQVTAAIHRVARDHYLRTQDGRQLPQTSKPELIATMLRLLDVQPGHRVLEVGTGSGYSTALLAHLVGAGGQVISLDIDPRHGHPTRRLLALDGHTNVTVLHADGRLGHPPGAPYDRLVAWAQAPQASPRLDRACPPGRHHRGPTAAPHRPGGQAAGPLHPSTGGGAADRCRLHSLPAKPLRPWEDDNHAPS